jgi:hypothetical protein
MIVTTVGFKDGTVPVTKKRLLCYQSEATFDFGFGVRDDDGWILLRVILLEDF